MKRLMVAACVAAGIATVPAAVVGHAALLAVDGGIVFVQQESMTPPVTAEELVACRETVERPGATVQWGTSGADTFDGENHPQVFFGLGGGDILRGGNQEDCLIGGAGDDHISGHNASDILMGGPGNDVIYGGTAKDVIDGGTDSDTCVGGQGHDVVVGCEVGTP